MKIFELRITFGENYLLYLATYTIEEAARQRFEHLNKIHGDDLKTAKIIVRTPDDNGEFMLRDMIYLK